MKSKYRAIIALLVICSVVVVAVGLATPPSGAATSAAGRVSHELSYPSDSQSPAFNGDAPDPDILLYDGTYYAFTTGTVMGNYLQALIDTTGSPTSGWRSYTGGPYGSSALPVPPAWETLNTQTSPGVFEYGGHWVMFYDAAVKPYSEAQGHSCLSVATASSLTPGDPVFTDTSTSPLFCMAGGVLDPSPFVDPQTGIAYLVFKSNDGGSTEPSQVWSVPLAADGTSFAGTPKAIFTVDQAQLPWETTTDDPQIVYAGGSYRLLFSVGAWSSSNYAEVLTTCSGPLGPCNQPTTGPFLTSYGTVAGPGGGSLFTDATGQWWLGYAAWNSSCTSYSCGGARRLFVTPINLGSSLQVPCVPPGTTPIGYRLVASDGGIFSFGNLPFCGSTGSITLAKPVVGIASTPDGGGYWAVASDGGIFAFGDAGYYGSMGGKHLNAPIVGMAATPNGKGYWLVASDGGVFCFGDAGFHGSTGHMRLNEPIVGMAATAGGTGYWLVAADGGVFSFNATFHGSTGNMRLAKPVVGMALDGLTGGYWLVASDGGIFSFDAKFHGSMGGKFLVKPVVGMQPTGGGGGYELVASDGGIFSFSAPFYGSMGGKPLNKPVVGMSGF
jgi:Glycosyl hydrolases family 43